MRLDRGTRRCSTRSSRPRRGRERAAGRVAVCGFGVEIRPGGRPDRDALERMGDVARAARARRRRPVARRPRRARAPAAGDHRPVRARRAADARRRRSASPSSSTAASTTTASCAPSSSGSATRSSPRATPRCCSRAGREWGEGVLDRLAGHVRVRAGRGATGRVVLARDRLGVKPLYLAELPGGGLRAASSLPALVRAGGVDTTVDPVALHHYLSWHSIVPAPRTILRGVGKLPPATVLVIEPDGTRRERRWWDPPFDARARGWSPADWTDAVREALRVAVRRRMVADVPVGHPALRRARLVADRRAARRAGPARAGDVLDRVPGRGRARGQRVRVLRPRRARVRDRAPADPRRAGADRRGAAGAIDAMSEPMVSHDAVAFWLLSRGRGARAQGRAVRPGRRRGVRRLLLVPAAAGGARATGSTPTRGAFFDRDHAGIARAGGAGVDAGRGRLARVRGRVVRAAGRGHAGGPRRCGSTPR